jgi:hypothetical protein
MSQSGPAIVPHALGPIGLLTVPSRCPMHTQTHMHTHGLPFD